MEISEYKEPSLRETFIDKMQGMILSGELPIGSKIPTERTLAADMQVSRQVINSGIAELTRRGFLNVVPRHGTYVADFRAKGNLNTLIAIMDYRGTNIRKEEIRSILEVRWGLERMTVRDVINNASDSDIDSLKKPLKKLHDSKTPEEAAENAFDFQHAMAVIGGNTVLPLIYASFKPVVITMWERFVELYGVPTLYDNSATTYEYLKSRDFEGCNKWLDMFIRNAIDGNQQIYDL